MKIIDIEIIPIVVPVARRHKDQKSGLVRMRGIDERIVVKVKTDNGIFGYGDYEGESKPPPVSEIETVVDRNPFDFIGNDFHLALGMALYDVMGKYLEVPAYKLMGQKLRDGVSVAAWTRPCPPDVFATEIQRAISQGYNTFKMHTAPYWDVFEQSRAAAEIAPEGFKIHWDFTGRRGRTLGAVLPIIEELERNHPIVGYIEDPLDQSDIDGWRNLRQRTRLPIVHGGAPRLGGAHEMLRGMADIYMIGNSIGTTLALGKAYGLANIQCLLQQTGGTLSKALSLHIAAVLPSCTGHSVLCDDQYDDDITTENIPVIEGFSKVPEEPGLGIQVNEDLLKLAANRKPYTAPRALAIVHLPGGQTIHTKMWPDLKSITGREEGTIRGINVEVWEEDGTKEFEEIYLRVNQETDSS